MEPQITALVAGKNVDLLRSCVQPLADAKFLSLVRYDGGTIREALAQHSPSIIIAGVDFYLRRLARLVKRPKGQRQIPPVLIFVSLIELGEEGLHAGGSDVVVVPCSSAEMELRIRRANVESAATPDTNLLRVGDITLDLATFRVAVGGEPRQLSWMEFQLLKLLMENFGRVLTREHILGLVWATDHLGGTRTVDVHISRLRFKLGSKASSHFRTVKNVGYGLV